MVKAIKSTFRAPFRKYIILKADRESVSRGAAVGMFSAAIPIMPFQTVIAFFLSLLLRANLPAALALSWVSNPFTLLPLTYFTYKVGNFILGEPQAKLQTLFHEFIWNFKTDHYWDSFSMWILQFGKAFFVGLPIVALGMAVLGYFIVTLFWKGKRFLGNHRK